ncbi:MAG: hypothetical protein RMM53_08765 [Bacteroidia bacterium]|nr:putative ABC transporter permease [Bacteroidia bacterium]MDW8334291.1 hypothetical protein [Bacteroidia bacterium]
MTGRTKGWFLFGFFGCFGMAAEVLFTAVFGFHERETGIVGLWEGMQNRHPDWRLPGGSYVWMFPIYGLSGWLFPPVVKKIIKYPLLFRLIVYMTGIYVVELATGWLLEMFIGVCPWDYNGPHIFKYINLPHAPAWMLMGFAIEKIILFFDRVIAVKDDQNFFDN